MNVYGSITCQWHIVKHSDELFASVLVCAEPTKASGSNDVASSDPMHSTGAVLMTLSCVLSPILPSYSSSDPSPLSGCSHSSPMPGYFHHSGDGQTHPLPEGKPNRSTSWVVASPLSPPHPPPQRGSVSCLWGYNTDAALFPCFIQPAQLMCWEGWRESNNEAENAAVAMSGTFSKPMWRWGVGAFLRWTSG